MAGTFFLPPLSDFIFQNLFDGLSQLWMPHTFRRTIGCQATAGWVGQGGERRLFTQCDGSVCNNPTPSNSNVILLLPKPLYPTSYHLLKQISSTVAELTKNHDCWVELFSFSNWWFVFKSKKTEENYFAFFWDLLHLLLLVTDGKPRTKPHHVCYLFQRFARHTWDSIWGVLMEYRLVGIVLGGGQAGICYMRHYPSPQTPLRDMGRGGQSIHSQYIIILFLWRANTCHGSIEYKKNFQFLVWYKILSFVLLSLSLQQDFSCAVFAVIFCNIQLQIFLGQPLHWQLAQQPTLPSGRMDGGVSGALGN